MKLIHSILARLSASKARRLRKKALKEHSRATSEASHRLERAMRECQAIELFGHKHRRIASCKYLAGVGQYSDGISLPRLRLALSMVKLVKR